MIYLVSTFSGFINGFFDNFLLISSLNDVELVIIHNDPTETELQIINTFKSQIKNFQHIIVPLEGVYCSWNRGIMNSHGKYLAMWSIDDRRISDSLDLQAKFLDEHSEVGIVSGDYLKVFNYGDQKGYLKKDPVRFNNIQKIYKFNNGCFLMWRRKIHDKIGYFDEQLKIAGDWDFWMRVTRSYKPGRIDTLLGLYLREEGSGISKIKMKSRDFENPTINIRYYKYHIINPVYFKLKFPISINNIVNNEIMIDFTPTFNINIYSYILSFLFFNLTSVKKILVYLKYKILKKLS
jgi:hypothetical protein